MWSALAQAGSYDVRWRWVWVTWCVVAMAAIAFTALAWWFRESGGWRHHRHRGAHA